MANANVTILTTANTFLQWLINTNNLANLVNSLLNGTFYSDNGSLIIANGTIQLIGGSGTLLSVSGNVTISQVLTVGSIVDTGGATVQGNTVLFTSNSVLVQVANTVIAKNLISNTQTTLANANVVNANIITANVGTGNITLLQAAVANLFDIVLDSTSTYGVVNGNAVLNNLTVQGNTVIIGQIINSQNFLQLRTNAASDGTGTFLVYRGPTVGANAAIRFNQPTNTWQVTANDAQTYATLLTTGNIADSVTNNSLSAVASANAVEWAYNTALAAANTVSVWQNGTLVLNDANLNFLNTSSVNVSIQANGTGQVNISLTSNASGTANFTAANLGSLAVSGNATMNNAAITNNLTAANATFSNNVKTGNLTVTSNIATGNISVSGNLVGGNVTNTIFANTADLLSNAGVINSPNTVTLNIAFNNAFDITTANTTQSSINVAFAGWLPSGNMQTVTVVVRQPGAAPGNTAQTSANLVNWTNSQIVWSNGEVPVLAGFKGKLDILTFVTVDGGLHIYGAHSMANVG